MNSKESGKRYMGGLRVEKWREKCCNYISFSKKVIKNLAKLHNIYKKLNFWMYVSICICMCGDMCVEARGLPWLLISDIVCLILLGQSLSLVWELPSKLNRLPLDSQPSTCLGLPSAGLRRVHQHKQPSTHGFWVFIPGPLTCNANSLSPELSF